MNNELLLLIKKHTHTLIEQTKTRPQETIQTRLILVSRKILHKFVNFVQIFA